ncbi:MAG TPA: trigger factor [Candidatus Aphodocola excrementigallinarum]|uniref:Trigger factor n=1 Tax=Candidatus Aphodocola excrementigallinarum TaxID=2840670 RepID=A0A9D1IQG4_9FIRM|nr:trigger factor [Candidatus Aphodocola excrementigallinarum]
MAEKKETKEKKAKNIHEIKIEIKGDEWAKKLDDAFKKEVKKVKIDGFRQGKAPRNIYEKKYGKASLVVTAVDDSMNEAYQEALKKFNDMPIVQPTVEIEKANTDGVIYKFTFTTKPEVKINKYTDLGVKKDVVKVTKKDVDNEIENLKKQYADLQVKDGAIENGDTAIIDFEGFMDGKAFEGGKAENYSLEIGSNSFIPGFEDALIGLKSGDEKDIDLTFPKDYHAEDLKGKPVTFKVKVHEVKTKVYPELDEEFFKDLGLDDVKTKEDLEKTIKKAMTDQKEYEAENKYVDELFDALLKETKVEIPHELVHEEIDRMVKDYEERLKMQGLTLEQFYKFTNSNEDALKDQMHEEAEKRVKLRFAIDEIINLEKIDATDEEAEKDAEEKAKKHGMDKDEYIKAFGGLEMLKYDIKVQKVLDILKK